LNYGEHHTTIRDGLANNIEDNPVTRLMRSVRAVSAGDGVGAAVALMRAANSSALPVVDGGGLVGIITEDDIARAINDGFEAGMGRSSIAAAKRVADVMIRQVPCVTHSMSLRQALGVITSSGTAALPVVDDSGAVMGLVFRGDLVAYLCNVLRPPTIAGMATPLGVYLTSGTLRAGAGDFGLFLSGVMLMVLNDLARLGMWLLAILVKAGFHVDALSYLASPAISLPNRLDAVHYVAMFVQAATLLFLLRMSPLARYHAAEHQVVNAIETGQPLIPEVVARMSRVHARCGTNLAAAAMIFVVITQRFTGPVALVVALAIVFSFWRAIGGYLQYVFTTRRPSEKHIASGIEAGKELLAKYQGNLNPLPTGWQRIWNMGLLQVACGAAVVLLLELLLSETFGIMLPV